ncbi:formate C-acetyltransferase/glycerol dehydratase family glycyl radical enzyme [Bacillus sp. V3-13]|nr:pyruvate formate lyase family protein [Bacillus sp. V3-13]PLR77403.1 formate C-acetyltransferase/glycerol dehydratase family glycyl radical enzyme [Bacillus sp. V3-13]
MAIELSSFQLEIKPQRSARMDALYKHITSFKPGICIERAYYMTEIYRQNMNLPAIVRRAKAIANVLENMSIYLMPGSFFVGNQTSKPRWAPLFPEFDVEWMEDEILNGNPSYPWDRPADKYDFNQEDREKLIEIINWWKGQTHTEALRGRLPKEALATHAQIKAADIGAYFQGGDGHFAPDHKWLFEHGLQYVIDQCEGYIANLDWTEPDTILKKDFYEAAIISCKATIKFANRYADLAEKMASQEKDVSRHMELKEIAEICRRVPLYPARTFREALQFIIFTHICIQIEDNGAGISFGRFDQILQNLYEKGIADGSLTRDAALELTENFYYQIYTINKVRSWEDTDYFRGVPMFQNLTVGGQNPKTKSDATNELSFICLEATANTRVPQPSLTVRFHNKSPLEFKMKVAEVIRLGMGLPSVFNDEVYIPALMNRGYELDDAYNYCIIGCVEPGTAGLLGGRTGGAWLNLTKILEMSLYGGTDPRTGIRLHPNQNGKDLESFSSFEEAKEAYIDQLEYYIKMEAILENTIDQLWEERLEEPIAAVFGCPTTTIPRGKPLKKGGAKYDLTGQQTIGTANVANSLYAIKKLIFEDKILTGKQLLHALKTEFKDMNTNPTGPEIKAMCLNIPKYGNDIDEVDFLARDMLAHAANTLVTYKNTRYGRGPIGGTLHCSTSTVSSNTPFGKVCGATPDGRDAWTSVADGQSPMRGTDKKGPTAATASVSKLNNILLSCGSLYNLKFVPEDLR